MELKEYIKTIPNFPKEGVMFRDVTSIIENKDGLKLAIDSIENLLKDIEFDNIVAPESRGFIFAMPVAYNMHKGMIPVRKKGKLPRETISEEYNLEYGTATLEMNIDSIKKGDKIVIIDDLLATGGTMEAMIKMVERLGGEVVRIVCLIELPDLKGREKLNKYDIKSCVVFEGE